MKRHGNQDGRAGTIRPPAVAGAFYPADPGELAAAVERHLASGRASLARLGAGPPAPKAMIVPHAGYVYSGRVAGAAYALLATRSAPVERVVLLGPAHRIACAGLAATSVAGFATPLGVVAIDQDAVGAALACAGVQMLDRAHEAEHCLEVQLPFLQRVAGEARIVPLLVGAAQPAAVAAVVERLWDGAETLVLVSSDLSHYHDYETAERLDRATCATVAALGDRLGDGTACGRVAIEGLLAASRRHHLRAYQLARCNSGDTDGPRDEVVGYAAFAFA